MRTINSIFFKMLFFKNYNVSEQILLAHFFLNVEKLYGETLYMYCRYYSEIMVSIISRI